MKKVVLELAKFLIAMNGKTTNLEIKNLFHFLTGGNKEFTQKEVSALMSSLTNEGCVERELKTNGELTYYVFSIKESQNDFSIFELLELETTQTALPASDVQAVSTPVVPANYVAVGSYNTDVLVQAAIQAVEKDKLSDLKIVQLNDEGDLQVGKAGTFATSFLQTLDPTLYLAFEKDKMVEAILFSTKDKFDARKLYKSYIEINKLPKVKHDDIRMIQLGTFLKKVS